MYVTHNRFFERPQDLCDALFGRFDYVRRHPQEIEGLLEACFVPFSNYNVELFMRVYIELEFRFSPVNHRAHEGIQASVYRCGGA